jgi:hypothetical protein
MQPPAHGAAALKPCCCPGLPLNQCLPGAQHQP